MKWIFAMSLNEGSKLKRLGGCIPADLYAQLHENAARRDVTFSEYVTDLLYGALASVPVSAETARPSGA